MKTRMLVVALVALALVVAVGGGDAGARGPQSRMYRVWVGEWVPIGSRLTVAVRFKVDHSGKLRALYATPARDAQYGLHDWAVGTVWINGPGGQQWDDAFAVDYPIAAGTTVRVARLGPPVTSPMWVEAGDIVTILWDDDESRPPPWPPCTWYLEVRER